MSHQHRNIFRQRYGWLVAIKRQRRWVRSRFFRDKPSRQAALDRAIRWRDHQLAGLPPPRKFKSRYSRSATGIPGVYRGRARTRAGTLVFRYVASWLDEHGRLRARSFSVRKYGAAKARALAIDVRKHVLAEMLRPQRAVRPAPRR